MYKMKKRIAAIIAAALMFSLFSGCFFDIDDLNIDDTNDYSEYDHSSTYTLMVYLCGSNLESDGGCATAALCEMIAGYNGNESVNILCRIRTRIGIRSFLASIA